MVRKRYMSSLRPISDVQLTSFMDLSFLLLVTFIITFPLLEQGIPVNLPRGSAEDLRREHGTHTITLDRKGQIYLDNLPTSMENLIAEVNRLRAADPDVAFQLRADEKIEYGRVVQVVRVLYNAKVGRMSLVTRPD
ncbi:MAG: biopolymer transporter ExbD [Kiritimatiellae bacterium]|nr:biopolymer transporter ExbD [Kiritimatiellia bacterium]